MSGRERGRIPFRHDQKGWILLRKTRAATSVVKLSMDAADDRYSQPKLNASYMLA